MINLCLGMTKAASTLAYQLTEEVLRQGGRRPLVLGKPLQRASATTNYFDRIDAALIDAVREAAGSRPVVLKSHQRPEPAVIAMIRSGDVLASYAIRDPREMALSMIDHGVQSRRRGLSEFSECLTVADCLPSIDHQIESFALLRDCTGLLVLPYNETCFATERAVTRIAAQIGVTVDAGRIARDFAGGRMTGMFNRGTPLRHRELDEETSALMLSRYAEFYAANDLMPHHARDVQGTEAARPPSRFVQELTHWRRWARAHLGWRL